jgi:hypothetical protein
VREVEPSTDEMALYNEVSGRISAGIRALIKAGSLMRLACLSSLPHIAPLAPHWAVFATACWMDNVRMPIKSGVALL